MWLQHQYYRKCFFTIKLPPPPPFIIGKRTLDRIVKLPLTIFKKERKAITCKTTISKPHV